MPKKVALAESVYLGGLPDTKPSRQSLNLFFTDEGIGQGMMFSPKNVIKWEDIAGVSFDSSMAKKSRAGKAVAFGVFALAAKNSAERGRGDRFAERRQRGALPGAREVRSTDTREGAAVPRLQWCAMPGRHASR